MTGDGSIVVTDLTFRYGQRSIFEQFSCRFDVGAMTGLVGPSGSGKSTLLALILGQLVPAGGSIWSPGHLGSGGRVDPRRVGWVMQSANVLTRRSAVDNVAVPSRVMGVSATVARARAVDALGGVGLAERVDDRCGLLSGGERQRVAVARALAVGAGLIVADEPTVSLDHANRDRLVDALAAAAARGAIVVVATHDPAVYGACDSVVRL